MENDGTSELVSYSTILRDATDLDGHPMQDTLQPRPMRA